MKTKFIYLFAIVVIIIIFLNNKILAQNAPQGKQVYTDIPGGDISGTLTCAGSPYNILGDITVPIGDELIVEPCVELFFGPGCKLDVRGRLLAEGTDADQIIFTTSDMGDRWEGIKFININSNGQDSSKMVNCVISYSSADPGGPSSNNRGGALYFKLASNVLVENCTMNNNYAANSGGAIFLEGSLPALINNNIRDNSSPNGGAVFFQYCNATINGGIIENNEAENGGAFYLNGSNPLFSDVTIRNNYAKFGGGIFMYGGSTPSFDPVNLCNIYMNYAYACGLDFCTTFWWGSPITINVDTFAVLDPDKHFVYPEDIYTLNIQNGKIDQVASNLYVSPSGSDANSGTSPGEPLKTMHTALMKIVADTLHPKTIYLEDGIYSESATGEMMPINWREHVDMIGGGSSTTSIDGEDANQILYCYDDNYFEMDGIGFSNGFTEDNGGAICLEHFSSPKMTNLLIRDNNVSGDGGGVYVDDHSSPEISHVDIYDNFAAGGGGGICLQSYSNPVFRFVNINGNSANYTGGGLRSFSHCDFIMDSVSVFGNSAAHGAGMYVYSSDPLITNSDIYNNFAVSYPGYQASGGGAFIVSGFAVFNKVEVRGNTSENNAGGIYCGGNILFLNGKVNNNYAQNSAGGLYLYGIGDKKIINSEICANVADDYQGAAIYASSSSGQFTNVTVANNLSVNDYACLIYCQNSNIAFTNSILWGNSPIWFDIPSGNITAEYSDTQFPLPGTGNISSDPLFTDFVASDYSLLAASPCIDVGTPDTTGLNLPLLDLANTPRIVNEIIDMGAYEYYTGIKLALSVFLEGPFNGVDMNTFLYDDIPLMQPYNASPWNYNGTESVASIPANVVDWVLIELRDTNFAALAINETIIARQSTFLLNDGSVVDMDGVPVLIVDHSYDNSLFVVVWQRNHLGIMSATALSEIDGVYRYDFTAPEGQAFDEGAQANLGGGLFGMFAGDGDANGVVGYVDVSDVWAVEAGESGYMPGDYNLDSEVDNNDKNDFSLPNDGEVCQVPDEINFSCGDTFIDGRNGQMYNSVQIGGQCWMGNNLNIGSLTISTADQSDNGIIEKYCMGDNLSQCELWGGLYQWDEIMNYSTTPGIQGICPVGWHLPTDDEWCTLENEVETGAISCSSVGWRGIDAGGNLKSTWPGHWDEPNVGATNSSGFSAIGAGYRQSSGGFGGLQVYTHFWSSSNFGTTQAWRRGLFNGDPTVGRIHYDKYFGDSVRCIHD